MSLADQYGRGHSGRKCVEKPVQPGLGGQYTHHSDAEDLARERSQAWCNIGAEFVQRTPPDFRVVQVFGHAHGVKGSRTVDWHVHLQAQRFHATYERVMVGQVPRETRRA